jgi:hypothetical protein
MSKIQAFRLNKLPKTTAMYLEKDGRSLTEFSHRPFRRVKMSNATTASFLDFD